MGRCKTLIYMMFGLVLLGGELAMADAESNISVRFEGAQETIHLDMANGALYIGDDCEPLLYFVSSASTRSQQVTRREYRVVKGNGRRSSRGGIAPRLPDRIIVSDDNVEILSQSLQGISRATGRKLKHSSVSVRQARCKSSDPS